MELIGISGKIGSGKTTVARHLIEHYDFEEWSFATALKAAARAIFGFTDEQMFTEEGKKAVDEWWQNTHGPIVVKKGPSVFTAEEFTPRLALQLLGTEAMREVFGKDIWINALFRRLDKHPGKRNIVSDVRFPNEAKAILNRGGRVIRLTGRVGESAYPNHPSEIALDNFQDFTAVFDNSGNLGDLLLQINGFMNGPQRMAQ